MNSKTCALLGFSGGGALSCYSNCGFDTRSCVAAATCGTTPGVDPGEACDGAVDLATTCDTLGFAGVTVTGPGAPVYLTCDPNCGINVSNCPGAVTSVAPKKFDDLNATSTLVGQLEVLDSLGNVGPIGAGPSSHKVWISFVRQSANSWILRFFGPGPEYGMAEDTSVSLGQFALGFTGKNLTSVDGAATDKVHIRLGDPAGSGAFAGSDGGVAPLLERQTV